MAGPPSYPGMPRWLKRSTIALSVAALLLVALVHIGSGPSHPVPLIGSLDHHAAQGGR